MKKKIVIAGGTGFIGRHLAKYFKSQYDVIVLTRGASHELEGVRFVHWDGAKFGDWTKELEGAHALINMAGRTVDCRYNAVNRKQIYDSRIFSTEALGKALEVCKRRPGVWLNSSTATIYRYSEDKAMTEQNGEIGTGFSVDVAKKWEAQFFSFKSLPLRQVVMRTTIVLGSGGGVMEPYSSLAKFGLGGKHGHGRQMFSWIHIKDFCRVLEFLINNQEMEGVFNVSAPNPLPNHELMNQLRHKYAPYNLGIPLPKCLLEFGASIIRTETELLLKSRWVLPERLLKSGFEFRYPTISKAISSFV